LAPYSVLLVKEVVVGLIIGYVSMLTFHAITVAGELIDIQMGFSMASVFDPQNQSRMALVGRFMYLVEMLLFLSIPKGKA
jgi:flagellar biosynthetic protein FliR